MELEHPLVIFRGAQLPLAEFNAKDNFLEQHKSCVYTQFKKINQLLEQLLDQLSSKFLGQLFEE